jgi:hypothetical protein
MPIQHIVELFALDERDFIIEAYRNILGREPDPHGAAYYLGCMSLGHGKASVIVQLAQSKEARAPGEIVGLKKLIANERRANHWFMGGFGRNHREERLLRAVAERFEHIDSQIKEMREGLGNTPQSQRLPVALVYQVFLEILGREPESKAVIDHHARFENIEALRNALRDTEEYKSVMARMAEMAPRARQLSADLKNAIESSKPVNS